VTPVLRTVLLADVVDSTALVQLLGDARAAALLQRMELCLRDLFVQTGGQFIDRADGVLVLFERPVQAVDFALRYQRLLNQLAEEFQAPPIRVRVGIHVGEVMTWANDPRAVLAGAKPLEVEGLAKPVAARLMALALPGQVLMSGMAQTLAQRAAAELGERSENLRWLVHGRYRFKGVPAPMLVHEVGEIGTAPLRAPPSGQKVWREIPLWRRPPVLAVEIAAVIGIALASLFGAFKSEPALAFNPHDWVVVGDLNNLSGDQKLSEPLETALRIGLQQSAYVNVLSDARVDETLHRMGMNDNTPVDRALGSEIAAREGARALILPTLSQVGGKLRISLEVIDPRTQATVFTEIAEGRELGSVLASLDTVHRALRRRLGEGQASVGSSKPLEQVTTSDLEALRAYSLGLKARSASRYQEAEKFMTAAIERDPDFAMAYVGLAMIHYVADDHVVAHDLLAQASARSQRLTMRESLQLSAVLAMYGPPEKALANWKVVVGMFPDDYRAAYAGAYIAHHELMDYDEALRILQPALSASQNPTLSNAYYLDGVLELSLNHYRAAEDAFAQAESLGVRGFKREYAETYAAQRRYDLARRTLATQTPTGNAGTDLDQRLGEITFALDQGKWQDALEASRRLRSLSLDEPAAIQKLYAGIDLALRTYDDPKAPGLRRDLRRHVESLLAAMPAATFPDRRHLTFQSLACAWLAARAGDTALANQVLEATQKQVEADKVPANREMLVIVQAELDLAAGQPENAATRLKDIESPHLYFTHVEHRYIADALGEYGEALREAEWLVQNRGTAYAEYNSRSMWQPVNVLESNLALQSAAGYAEKLGNLKLAQDRNQQFLEAWPDYRGPRLDKR
jgi:putative peptide modification system cyclase